MLFVKLRRAFLVLLVTIAADDRAGVLVPWVTHRRPGGMTTVVGPAFSTLAPAEAKVLQCLADTGIWLLQEGNPNPFADKLGIQV